uniref:Uncharacterized protein n=1 Tax=Arundo donax TaxID=35708 RepID=A0A0A9ET32_ARUDO
MSSSPQLDPFHTGEQKVMAAALLFPTSDGAATNHDLKCGDGPQEGWPRRADDAETSRDGRTTMNGAPNLRTSWRPADGRRDGAKTVAWFGEEEPPRADRACRSSPRRRFAARVGGQRGSSSLPIGTARGGGKSISGCGGPRQGSAPAVP